MARKPCSSLCPPRTSSSAGISADKRYMVFPPLLFVHRCALFLETGIFEMLIKSKLCRCLSHLISCLGCVQCNPNRGLLFLWDLGAPWAWPVLSRRLPSSLKEQCVLTTPYLKKKKNQQKKHPPTHVVLACCKQGDAGSCLTAEPST